MGRPPWTIRVAYLCALGRLLAPPPPSLLPAFFRQCEASPPNFTDADREHVRLLTSYARAVTELKGLIAPPFLEEEESTWDEASG